MLTQDQIDFFHETGYLVVLDAVTAAELAAIKKDFVFWLDVKSVSFPITK